MRMAASRLRWSGVAFLGGIAGAGMLAVWILSRTPPPPFAGPSELPDADRLVVGALHVHSVYSDGQGDVPAISRDASDAGLDFWILTDHQRLDGLVEVGEGYSNGVLRLIGVEATTDAGHIVGLDLPPTPLRFGSEASEVLRQISELGGFALAAHPNAERSDFAWSGWSLPGFVGIELFNTYAAYRRNGILRSLAYLLLNPTWQTGDLRWQPDWDADLLSMWTERSRDRKLSVWAGVDAHGGIELTSDYALPWPTYRTLFHTARNYLLLDEPLSGFVPTDRRLIYSALRDGRGYVALEDHPGAHQFRFQAERDAREWPMGSDIVFDASSQEVTLTAVIPVEVDAELRIFRDGVLVGESRTGRLSLRAEEPGVYRAEARIGGGPGNTEYQPWIQSNPIAVLAEAQIEQRLARTRPAAISNQVETIAPAREFVSGVRAEGNPECRSVEVDASGLAESSFRVGFELGVPAPDAQPDLSTPFARCAAAYRAAYDLSSYSGIRFRVRGDGIYRVSLELHDPNPESSADGMEPWDVSFLTAPEWTEIVVSFEQFQSAGPASDGRLDLADVGGILFMFDTWNTRPGTAGNVEFEEFAFFSNGLEAEGQ